MDSVVMWNGFVQVMMGTSGNLLQAWEGHFYSNKRQRFSLPAERPSASEKLLCSIECDDVEWIYLARDRYQWKSLEDMAGYPLVSLQMEILLLK
jgi:hypothetical protein